MSSNNQSTRCGITLIAAYGNNGVLGKDGEIPWRIPADMAWFKEKTTGKPVVMGRKTWESLPQPFRPLPHRRNIVLTKNTAYLAPGAEVMHHVADVLNMPMTQGEIMIIGGGLVYDTFLPYADRMILTMVDYNGAGDTHFPAWQVDKWEQVFEEAHDATTNAPAYTFTIWQKK